MRRHTRRLEEYVGARRPLQHLFDTAQSPRVALQAAMALDKMLSEGEHWTKGIGVFARLVRLVGAEWNHLSEVWYLRCAWTDISE